MKKKKISISMTNWTNEKKNFCTLHFVMRAKIVLARTTREAGCSRNPATGPGQRSIPGATGSPDPWPGSRRELEASAYPGPWAQSAPTQAMWILRLNTCHDCNYKLYKSQSVDTTLQPAKCFHRTSTKH